MSTQSFSRDSCYMNIIRSFYSMKFFPETISRNCEMLLFANHFFGTYCNPVMHLAAPSRFIELRSARSNGLRPCRLTRSRPLVSKSGRSIRKPCVSFICRPSSFPTCEFISSLIKMSTTNLQLIYTLKNKCFGIIK